MRKYLKLPFILLLKISRVMFSSVPRNNNNKQRQRVKNERGRIILMGIWEGNLQLSTWHTNQIISSWYHCLFFGDVYLLDSFPFLKKRERKVFIRKVNFLLNRKNKVDGNIYKHIECLKEFWRFIWGDVRIENVWGFFSLDEQVKAIKSHKSRSFTKALNKLCIDFRRLCVLMNECLFVVTFL